MDTVPLRRGSLHQFGSRRPYLAAGVVPACQKYVKVLAGETRRQHFRYPGVPIFFTITHSQLGALGGELG
jgi:hypothetical protein